MMATGNQDIIERLNNGNEDALKELFFRYSPRLKGYAFIYIDDVRVVEDIVQECFVILWERRKTLHDISVKAFLFTMVRNKCFNWLRHRKVEHGVHYDIARRWAENLYATDLRDSETETEVHFRQLEDEVNTVLLSLPERQREIFRLSRFYGMPTKDVAKRLNLSASSVDKTVSKVTKMLKDHLCLVYKKVNMYYGK